MGMFDKYDNLNPDFIPDNTSPTPSTAFLTIDEMLPRPYRDIKGRLIGYTWNYGEHFKFSLSTDDMIVILNDSIVYNNVGEKPNNFTVGERVGQQAYNTVDAKSWTYVGKSNELYIWVEDDELTYPTDGDRSIIIHSDMTDKHPQLNIYDFKWNSLFEVSSNDGESKVYLDINEKTSEQLKPGVYYCTLKIVGKDSCRLKHKMVLVIN